MQFSQADRDLVDSGGEFAVVVSCSPMSQQLETQLFGDPTTVFNRDLDGHECRVDHVLNVQLSGAQHDAFFWVLEDVVVEQWAFWTERPVALLRRGCGSQWTTGLS